MTRFSFSSRRRYFWSVRWLASGAFALTLLATAPLQAGSIGDNAAVSFTGVTANLNNGYSWSLGWQFTTNVPIAVDALGYYNASLTGGDTSFQDGTCNCGEVGIYDTSGDLLASATVTSADPVNGFFNWAAIPVLDLPAGQTYYVVAETGPSDYTFYTTGFSVSPDITFDQDAYVQSSTLAFPTASGGITASDGGAYFGANFDETSVPEPASLPLCGAAIIGLLGVAKRKLTA